MWPSYSPIFKTANPVFTWKTWCPGSSQNESHMCPVGSCCCLRKWAGRHTPVLPRGELHLFLLQRGVQLSTSSTPLPCTRCGGVYEQTGFTDISVATRPDPACAADAAVPLWDSAQAACVWATAHGASSISPAVPVRILVLSPLPACPPSHWGCKLCLSTIGAFF